MLNGNPEDQKYQGIKLIENAWEHRETLLKREWIQKLDTLKRKIESVKNELEIANKRIEDLEEENSYLGSKVQGLQKDNSKLESIKAKLVNALQDSTETADLKEDFFSPASTTSPKSAFSEKVSVSQVSNKYVHGKQFFSQARLKLSYEKFNSFLYYIKKLNDKSMSRERVIEEVREIFGNQNWELYRDFITLIKNK